MNTLISKIFLGIAFIASSHVALAGNNEEQCIAAASDIEAKLKCIDRITVKEKTNVKPGVLQFELTYKQPADHTDASKGTFEQRVALIHKSETEPMVLQTSGYSIFGVRESLLARTFAANQIQIEHRYFSGSIPANADWALLNIKQSADDFHDITVSLKKIYNKPWVNTGASKGGMTSTYHRRFYPNDVVGTVADVAPLSFSTSDERYIDFVANVGGDKYASCRAALEALQVSLLEERDELTPSMQGDFSFLGGKDVAFEHQVIESAFIFWQYKSPEDPEVGCARIPAPTESATLRLAYLEKINEVGNYTSDGLQGFLAYYFQAATQLGNPGNLTRHLDHLRRHEFTIDQYTPRGLHYTYSNAEMYDIENWIKTESNDIIFIYGELDPWSAGAYPVRDNEHRTYKLWAAGKNHGAKFSDLRGADYELAMRTMRAWFGKKEVTIKGGEDDGPETLDELEFKVRQRLKL